MPLRSGSDRATISSNIREMVAAGHPVKQAIAASLANAHRHAVGGLVNRRFADGGGLFGGTGGNLFQSTPGETQVNTSGGAINTNAPIGTGQTPLANWQQNTPAPDPQADAWANSRLQGWDGGALNATPTPLGPVPVTYPDATGASFQNPHTTIQGYDFAKDQTQGNWTPPPSSVNGITTLQPSAPTNYNAGTEYRYNTGALMNSGQGTQPAPFSSGTWANPTNAPIPIPTAANLASAYPSISPSVAGLAAQPLQIAAGYNPAQHQTGNAPPAQNPYNQYASSTGAAVGDTYGPAPLTAAEMAQLSQIPANLLFKRGSPQDTPANRAALAAALPAALRPQGDIQATTDAFNQLDAARRANPNDPFLLQQTILASQAMNTATYGPMYNEIGYQDPSTWGYIPLTPAQIAANRARSADTAYMAQHAVNPVTRAHYQHKLEENAGPPRNANGNLMPSAAGLARTAANNTHRQQDRLDARAAAQAARRRPDNGSSLTQTHLGEIDRSLGPQGASLASWLRPYVNPQGQTVPLTPPASFTNATTGGSPAGQNFNTWLQGIGGYQGIPTWLENQGANGPSGLPAGAPGGWGGISAALQKLAQRHGVTGMASGGKVGGLGQTQRGPANEPSDPATMIPVGIIR